MENKDNERVIKLETEFPYVKSDITEIWSTITPIVRENEEVKSDQIRHLNRLDNLEKSAALTDTNIKKIGDTIASYDESLKFLANARKNINTIFVAIAIQTIFLIGGLLAFVFVLTQKSTVQGQSFFQHDKQQQQLGVVNNPILQQPFQPTSPVPQPYNIQQQQQQQQQPRRQGGE